MRNTKKLPRKQLENSLHGLIFTQLKDKIPTIIQNPNDDFLESLFNNDYKTIRHN